VSVPLDRWLPNTWANYSLNNGKDGTTHNRLNGTALEGDKLSWNVQQGLDSANNNTSTSMNADYKGTYGEVRGVSQDSHQHTVNAGIQGGIVAHSDGVTFGQTLGETVVLIKAPGTHGTHVANQTGVETDYRGYTWCLCHPWRHNPISLDTETLPDDADVTRLADGHQRAAR
jgi:outer membrane usher protein